MSNAAIYARYSTDLQDETSIDDQIALAERWAEKHGHVVPSPNRFMDYAKSGGSVHLREGFKSMMAAAYRGDFSILYVENVSRLSRNNGDVQKIVEQLTFLDIAVIEAATGTMLDPMSAAVKGLVAHLTREQTAQMVRRGLDGVVRSGFSAGGRAYGYRSVPREPHERQRGGVLEIIPSEAAIVEEIFRRYADGETPRAIAEDLNRRGVKPPRGTRWASSCIHGQKGRGSGILNNQLYRGLIVWNKNRMLVNPRTGKRVSRCNPESEWVRTEARHLRIVSDALWDAVETKKAKKASEPPQRARAAKRIFSGLLRCGACGSGMSLKGRDKTGRVRIQCTRAKESGDCPDPRTYYVNDIEERVLSKLRCELQEPETIRAALDAYEAEMKRLRLASTSKRAGLGRELEQVTARANRLNALLMDGIGDAARINAELQVVLMRENELKLKVAATAAPTVVALHPSTRDRYLAAVARLHETLGVDGESEAARVVREVIEIVVLHPNGPSRNRHTAPPRIEVVGRLERLLGEAFLMPAAIGGMNGSGGGT